LAAAKEKSLNGLSTASTYAGQAASSMKEKADGLYSQNYHGQMYNNMTQKIGKYRGGNTGREDELGEDEMTTNFPTKNDQ